MTKIVPTPTGVDRLRAAADLLAQAPPAGHLYISTSADRPGDLGDAYTTISITGHASSIRSLLVHVDSFEPQEPYSHNGQTHQGYKATFQGVPLHLLALDVAVAA